MYDSGEDVKPCNAKANKKEKSPQSGLDLVILLHELAGLLELCNAFGQLSLSKRAGRGVLGSMNQINLNSQLSLFSESISHIWWVRSLPIRHLPANGTRRIASVLRLAQRGLDAAAVQIPAAIAMIF